MQMLQSGGKRALYYASYEYLDRYKEILLVRIHEEAGPLNKHMYRPYTWSATCICRKGSKAVTIVGTYRAPNLGESKATCRLLAVLGKEDIFWHRNTGKISHVSLKRFRQDGEI